MKPFILAVAALDFTYCIFMLFFVVKFLLRKKEQEHDEGPWPMRAGDVS